MKKLAALQAVKRAENQQFEQDLASVQKELELTRNDLENVRFREKINMQARDRAVHALKDANKRMEVAKRGSKRFYWPMESWKQTWELQTSRWRS